MLEMMNRMWKKVKAAEAASPTEEWLMFSYDPSAWAGEHYVAVSKGVPGAENVSLSGAYLTKVFEGPYKEAGRWYKEMGEYVKPKGREAKKICFFKKEDRKYVATFRKHGLS